MAKTLNTLTLAAPTSDPNIDVGQTFAFNVTPSFLGGGPVNPYSLRWEYNKNGAGWTACGITGSSSVGITVSASNPVTGVTAETNALRTATGQEADTYSVRVVGDPNSGTNYTVISNTQTVTVSGATTYIETAQSELSVSDQSLRAAIRSRLLQSTLAVSDGYVDNSPSAGTIYTETSQSLVATIFDGQFLRSIDVLATDDSLETVYDAGRELTLDVDATDSAGDIYDAGWSQREWSVIVDELGTPLWDEETHSVVPGAGGTTYTRTASSLLNVSELVTSFRRLSRERSSTTTVFDAKSASAFRQILKSDSIALADVLLRSAQRNSLASDAIAVTDSLIQSALRVRLSSDTIALIEAVLHSASLNRQTDDSFFIDDAVAAAILRNRFSDDALFLIDPFIKQQSGGTIYYETSTDSMVLTDQHQRVLWRVRVRDDALALVDALTRGRLLARQASESLSLTDAASHYEHRIRQVSDSLTLLDALSRFAFYDRDSDEAITVIDNLVKFYFPSGDLQVVTKTDEIIVIDNLQRQWWSVRVQGDALTITDLSSYTAYRSLTESEAILLVDALVVGARRHRQTSDAIVVTDAVTLNSIRNRLAADLLGVTDASTAVRAMHRAISDALFLVDPFIKQVSGGTILTRTINDSANVADSVIRRWWAWRTLSSVAEVTGYQDKVFIPSRTDSIAVVDESSYIFFAGRVASDAITAQDQALHFTSRLVNLADYIEISDDRYSVSLYTRDVVDLFDLEDTFDKTFISGLAALIDVRITVGFEQFISIGADRAIVLGAYNCCA